MASPFFDGVVWRDSATGAEVPNPGPFADPAHSPFVQARGIPSSHDFTKPRRAPQEKLGFFDEMGVFLGVITPYVVANAPSAFVKTVETGGEIAAGAIRLPFKLAGEGVRAGFGGLSEGLGLDFDIPGWVLPVGLGVLALVVLK